MQVWFYFCRRLFGVDWLIVLLIILVSVHMVLKGKSLLVSVDGGARRYVIPPATPTTLHGDEENFKLLVVINFLSLKYI